MCPCMYPCLLLYITLNRTPRWVMAIILDSSVMTQAGVPFTNNLAEQAVRMPKVKQKVSGCFRKPEGAKTYCIIRSYCATMHKQGANIFESLVAAFNGSTPQPNFV